MLFKYSFPKVIFLSIVLSFSFFVVKNFPAHAQAKEDNRKEGKIVFHPLVMAEAFPGHAEKGPQSVEAALQTAEAASPVVEAKPRTAEASTQADEENAGADEADAKPDKADAEAEDEDAEAQEPEEYQYETVFIKKIIFTGNTVISTATLEEVTQDFKDRDLSWDEIRSSADSVTMAYQELGYILAKAYVPEQEIKDGILEIRIVEGNVGKIEAKGNKYYHERIIKRYFQPQIRHAVIRESMLERALLMTKEVPSVETKVVLKKGEKPGTADVLLDTVDKIPLKLSLDYNNFGNKLVGEDRYGTRIEFTDPWWGNTLTLRGVTGNDSEDSSLGTVELAIPVNSYGTKVLFNYLNGNYLLGQQLADLGLEGETRVYGASIFHPILKTGTATLGVTAHYERKYSKSYTNDVLTSLDKLNVYGITINFDNLDRYLGKNIVLFDISHGEVYENKNPGMSRIKPDLAFDVVRVDLARIQKIYGNINLLVRGSGQISSDRLLSIEQRVLGGYGSVRGHEPALYLGDSGYTVTAELMFAPPFISEKIIFGQRIDQMMQLAVFFDNGGVYTSKLKPGEVGNEFLSGYGAGLRIFYKQLFRFKFDIGKPVRDKYYEDKDTYYYFLLDINIL